jgi:hypothetical protein
MKVVTGTELLNPFVNLTREEERHVFDLVGDLILSTDGAEHNTIFSAFKEKVDRGTLDLEKPPDLRLLLKMMMKCADTSNAAKL